MTKIIAFFIVLFSIASANETSVQSVEDSIKEKNEVLALKKELTEFYDKKEEEYQKNRSELENMLKKIESEKKKIENIKKENEEVLKKIKTGIATKATKIYDSMKPKPAAAIFNQMMDEGKIEDVFDIMIKLKEKKVTDIMKFLDVEYAALLTEKLRNKSK